MFIRVFAAALALSAIACVKSNGQLELDRYQHNLHPYAVFYTSGGTPKHPLGKDWRVDNFSIPEPRPGRAQRWDNRKPKLKHGSDYEVVRSYDLEDSGIATHKRTEHVYDLSLEHVQKDASMWVQTFAVSPHNQKKDLDVFAHRFVEASAGAGLVAVRFGVDGPVGAVEKRFATRILYETSCTLSGRDAYRVDFEMANVDQLELQSDARTLRGSIVYVRTGYGERILKARGAAFPVLMAAGLVARPKDFDALSDDFDLLLSQTVLGHQGQTLNTRGEHTCSLPAQARQTAPAVRAQPAAPVQVPAIETAPQEPATAPTGITP